MMHKRKMIVAALACVCGISEVVTTVGKVGENSHRRNRWRADHQLPNKAVMTSNNRDLSLFFRRSHLPATAADIETFEKQFSVKLPDDYRRFLLKYNGARMKDEVRLRLPDSPAVVRGMGGLRYIEDEHRESMGALLDQKNDIFEFRIPRDTVVIANDSFGNQFLLYTAGDRVGQIWFWTSQDEPIDEDRDQDFDNITLVAETFVEFLDKLYLLEE